MVCLGVLPMRAVIGGPTLPEVHKHTVWSGNAFRQDAIGCQSTFYRLGSSFGVVLTHLAQVVSASNSFSATIQRDGHLHLIKSHDENRDNVERVGGCVFGFAHCEPTDRLPASVPALGRSSTPLARV